MELKEFDLDGIEKVTSGRVETEHGVMELEFYPDVAPNTVANFADLAEKGFYDGLTFHRVIPGFVAQGGCPQGTGTGGPGYRIKCETENNPPHEKGSLSMAHAGKDTGGSQFFICFAPQPHLNGLHTVFGKVTDGLEILDKIEQGDKIVKVEVNR